MNKRIAFLLAAVLLVMAVLACGCTKKPASAPAETTGTGGGTGTDAESGTTDYLKSLPTPTFQDGEVRILVTSQLKDFYEQYNESSNIVDNACYRRNAIIEDRFGCELKYTDMDGNASGSAAFSQEIRTTSLGGESDAYDIIVGQNYYCLPLVSENLLHNLKSGGNFNWDADWYHQNINSAGEIHGKLYGGSGSFVVSQLAYEMACFYSKTVYAKYGFTENLYDLVRDKEWTYEKLYEMVTSFTSTSDDDQSSAAYGMIKFDHAAIGLTLSFGVDFVQRDAVGNLSMNAYGSAMEDVFEKIRSLMNDYSGVVSTSQLTYARGNIMAHVLFVQTYVHGLLEDELLQKSDSFTIGILPMPLLNRDQENYRTRIMRDELFYVPQCKSLENSSVIIEAMNYETMQLVNPAYWDRALEKRSSDTEDDMEMLQLIARTVYSGTEQYFREDLLNVNQQFALEALNNSASFSSWWGKNRKPLERQLSNVVAIYG